MRLASRTADRTSFSAGFALISHRPKSGRRCRRRRSTAPPLPSPAGSPHSPGSRRNCWAAQVASTCEAEDPHQLALDQRTKPHLSKHYDLGVQVFIYFYLCFLSETMAPPTNHPPNSGSTHKHRGYRLSWSRQKVAKVRPPPEAAGRHSAITFIHRLI